MAQEQAMEQVQTTRAQPVPVTALVMVQRLTAKQQVKRALAATMLQPVMVRLMVQGTKVLL
jgi:hypothetical protein